MERFTIEDSEEIKIGKTICDICFYKIDGTNEKCKKYDPKPKKIVDEPEKCPWANENPYAPW
ncbi:MAG: hypothetical protein J6K72_10205 [Clostridia bacterium]|nr:hypothetical protein [Clostridia bacterium]